MLYLLRKFFRFLSQYFYYFFNGLLFFVLLLKKTIIKFINALYYFFNGLLFIVLLFLNAIIRFINVLFDSSIKTIVQDKAAVYRFIVGICFCFYFVSVFFLVRYYVQSERSKAFSQSLIQSTETISEIEENIVSNYVADNSSYEINSNDNLSSDAVVSNNSNTSGYSYNYMDYINVNVRDYVSRNDDIVGWLKIDGTNVNISVVQSDDNSFYLNHDFYKRNSMSGWVFGDYRNNFESFNKNTIIYGHNMANGSMFGTLTRVVNPSWYKKKSNHFIKLNTKYYKTIWQVFSVYSIEPLVDYLQTVFVDDTSYDAFLLKIKDRSIYNFDVLLSSDDRILTLQTCDNTGNKRIVVHAKLYQYDLY